MSDPAIRLSDHFHRVKLTSLLLSSSLLFFSLSPPTSTDAKLFGVATIGTLKPPFLTACLLVAATVSAAHLFVLWWGEKKDTGLKLAGGQDMEAEFRMLHAEAIDLLKGWSSVLDRVTPTLSSEWVERSLPALERNEIEAALGDPFSETDVENRRVALDSLFKKLIDDVVRPLSYQLSRAKSSVASGTLQHDENSLTGHYRKPFPYDPLSIKMSDLQAFLQPFTGEGLRSQLIKLASDRLANELEDMRRRLVPMLALSEREQERVRTQLADLHQKLDFGATTLVEKLPAFSHDIRSARQALSRVKRVRRAEFILDLWVPAGLYLIAFAHAVGRLWWPRFWDVATIFERLLT